MSNPGNILSQAMAAFITVISLVIRPISPPFNQYQESPDPAAPASAQGGAVSPIDQPGSVEGSNRLFLPLIQAGAWTPAAPRSGSSSTFGLGVYSWSISLDDNSNIRTDWIRPEPVIWSAVEPKRGQREWSMLSGLEGELRAAAERGIQVELIVSGSPDWAQKVPGSECGPIKESELSTFARFMHDLVLRYSQPPFNVKYWEFWNEPDVDPSFSGSNDFGCWGDLDDPYYGGRYYAQMLKAVYPQVKSADSAAQVLVGGLLMACDPRDPNLCGGNTNGALSAKFLEGILLGGGGPYFDGVSFHAYDGYGGTLGAYGSYTWGSSWDENGPAAIAKGKFLREVLAQYGYIDKSLIVSETALSNKDPVCDGDCELSKAYYVPQLYLATLEENYLASIWYCLRCGWRHVDLLDGNGKPLPAYTAINVAREQLQGAGFAGPIAQPEKVKVYELQRGDRRLWVAWSLDRKTHSIRAPGQVVSVTDVLGVRQNVNGSVITVALKPLYIEWVP